MKNIAVVNSCNDGSIGKIARKLHNYLLDNGYNSTFYYARWDEIDDRNSFKFESNVEVKLHGLLCRVSGEEGCFSTHATKKLIKFLEWEPLDAIYVVNLHGYYLNASMFLEYVAKKDIPLIYIAGDEFPFWGKCGYNVDCDHYLNECRKCPGYKEYPNSWFFDRAHSMYLKKKKAYDAIEKIAFVGPEFTINQARKSPLVKEKRLEIVDEAVDVNFYHPRDTKNLKQELGISDDKIVLVCVAPMSNERKGCRYFIETARRLEHDDRFIFVHAGYNIKDKTNLPHNYIPISYLADQEVLAHYYSMADLFIFPSLNDTMPNTCLEAMSAGSPILGFNISGMPYIAPAPINTLVEPRNVDQLVEVVLKTKKKDRNIVEMCRDYAVKRYDNELYHKRLIEIGESLCNM